MFTISLSSNLGLCSATEGLPLPLRWGHKVSDFGYGDRDWRRDCGLHTRTEWLRRGWKFIEKTCRFKKEMITHLISSLHIKFVSPVFSNRSWVIEMFILLLAMRFFSAEYRHFIFSPNVSVSALSGLRILPFESLARIFFSSRWIFRTFRL